MSNMNSSVNNSKPSDNPKTNPPQKAKRFQVIGGVEHEVVKSHYDPRQACVIDTVMREKTVKNRKGDDVVIQVFRQGRCRDEAIQAKYAQNAMVPLEIEVTNE